MINVENPDFNMAVSNQYLLRNFSGEVRPIEWWHGFGGLLDYSNPEALAWWHSLIDKVLDVGADGFKCDATDPYVLEYSIGGGALGYQDKVITYPEYASAYYSDFLYYTRNRRSADTGTDSGLIMSRPVDCLVDPVTKLCVAHTPREIMFSGWVGDDDGTFNGLRGCLRKLIYSAWLNYANFGCDIGGYRASDTPEKLVMIRWTQAMAFVPLMENGGAGEHRPWMFDQQTLDIYRSFVLEHHKLSVYLHTTGANAVDKNRSSMLPLDENGLSDANFNLGDKIYFRQPKTYSYRLGQDILVHPVVWDAAENVSEISVVHQMFPYVDNDLSSTTRWLDWWAPWDRDRMHVSGDDISAIIPLKNYSVFVRQGALLPIVKQAYPSDDFTDLTNKLILFTWFGPSNSATANTKVSYEMRESITTGTGIVATAYFSTASSIEAQISAHDTVVAGFEIVGITKPSVVTVKAWSSSLCTDNYNEATTTLTVECQSIAGGVLIYIDGVSPTLLL
jgi:alpha-glucosidase (family GH31 glycosyl hydrolase)